jgi:hypothetical protein
VNVRDETPVSRFQVLQEEVREIARVLLKEHPPGTPMTKVWEELLTLHAVRYETEVLLPPHSGGK